MWHLTVEYVGADDLKELPYLGLFDPTDEGTMLLWNLELHNQQQTITSQKTWNLLNETKHYGEEALVMV